MAAGRFETLNPQQRRTVEHGGPAVGAAGPLLIIAGAGSGKTSTLAYRVAFLIENGADPRRIVLLTFARRAAAEMTRRVDRILSGLGRTAAVATTEAMWAGTFHSVGARLLRGILHRGGPPCAEGCSGLAGGNRSGATLVRSAPSPHSR
jgi:DNA helicase-2/ATP-dependent DNA helicase PcrA